MSATTARRQLLATAQRLRDECARIDQRRERMLDDYEPLPQVDPGAGLLDRATRLVTEGRRARCSRCGDRALIPSWLGRERRSSCQISRSSSGQV
jgi:hypothetical protein